MFLLLNLRIVWGILYFILKVPIKSTISDYTSNLTNKRNKSESNFIDSIYYTTRKDYKAVDSIKRLDFFSLQSQIFNIY